MSTYRNVMYKVWISINVYYLKKKRIEKKQRRSHPTKRVQSSTHYATLGIYKIEEQKYKKKNKNVFVVALNDSDLIA